MLRAMVVRCGLVALGAVAAAGCGDRGRAEAALLAAEPYVERFDRFDAWARRALASEAAPRLPGALEETLFAPLGLERIVADAWVRRSRIEPRSWSMRGAERVRPPRYGELSVLRATLPAAAGEGERDCLLLSRAAPGPSRATIEVIVAFLIAEGGGS